MKIMTLLGFEVKIDASWLVIAALVTFSLAERVFPMLHAGLRPDAYYTMALVAMLLFFASLVLHELGHAVVARRHGLEIGGITLFIFGGIAELGKEPDTPRAEFWIAIAGPIMSFALAGLLSLWSAALDGAAGAVIGYLATINLILALFNLLPAFPLDGGRILRAFLWWRSGNVLDATLKASRAGEVLAYALIALGLLSLFSGMVVSGLWQVLIGGFIFAAARGTYQSVLFKEGLRGETVASLMSTDLATVEPDATLAELVNQVMLRHRVSFVPIVEDGAVLGYVDNEILSKIDRENWSTTHVADVFNQADDSNSVAPSFSASELMKRIVETKRRKFLVTDGSVLLGVISLSDLTSYLALLQDLRGAQSFAQMEAAK